MGGPIERPAWDDYFLAIAEVVKTRSVCTRRQVGAVIARDNRIVATGYNGAPAGMIDCPDAPCPRASSGVPSGTSYDDGPGMCIAIHAEANAILYAGREACRGATLYCTNHPCTGCWKIIDSAGIERVVTSSDNRLVQYLSEGAHGP